MSDRQGPTDAVRHDSERIGIIADSHGRPNAIEVALVFLRQSDCRRIYHLGDICDSSRPETADTCVRLLQDNGVRAIRGNNDHRIVIDHLAEPRAAVSEATIEYLKGLPYIIECDSVIGAHSLPYADELGAACMIGDMQENHTRRFFFESPSGILFRGHGHSPRITWQADKEIITRPLAAGEELNLSGRIPCVITCGALTRGLCMVWHRKRMSLACLSVDKTV